MATVAPDRIRRFGRVIRVERKWQLRILSIAVFLTLWEYAGSGNFLVATPTEVVGSLIDQLFINPDLTAAIAQALIQGVFGFLLAVGIGIPLGFLIGFWQPARHVLNPVVDALYVTPVVTFIPLIIIWFGVTVQAKIFFVFLIAVLEVIINTEAGVSETPEGMIDAGRVFGASDRQLYTQVHLRHSLPFVLNGIRLSAGRAVRGMIIAELFVYAGLLGSYLVNSAAMFEMANLYAAIAALAILGVIALRAVEAVENWLLAYRVA